MTKGLPQRTVNVSRHSLEGLRDAIIKVGRLTVDRTSQPFRKQFLKVGDETVSERGIGSKAVDNDSTNEAEPVDLAMSTSPPN